MHFFFFFLLPRENNSEAYVFFKKMEADYNRYIGEVTTGEEKEKAINLAKVITQYKNIQYTIYNIP